MLSPCQLPHHLNQFSTQNKQREVISITNRTSEALHAGIKKSFIFILGLCVCARVCMDVHHMHAGARGDQKRGWIPWDWTKRLL